MAAKYFENTPILSQFCGKCSATQGTIGYYIRFITAMCISLMVPTITLAEDTTITETCADGAGVVIAGAVSEHKYCMSNKTMNWWNAVSWCDGLNKKLFNLNDCSCSGTINCTGKCPELALGTGGVYFWTANPKGTFEAYAIGMSDGYIGSGEHNNELGTAICK